MRLWKSERRPLGEGGSRTASDIILEQLLWACFQTKLLRVTKILMISFNVVLISSVYTIKLLECSIMLKNGSVKGTF